MLPEVNMESYQPIVGLEIHVELKTRSKMFCSCSAEYFGHEPNTRVCPICLGLPGSLPKANKKAIELTMLTALALNCEIPLFSKFDRKNYFYPDLPKGFQISQYDLPLGIKGYLKLQTPNSKLKTVRIRRVHLEEDTGKLIHATVVGKKCTLIDFNRSGVPLMEIVSEPDLRSIKEVGEYGKKIRQILRYLNVSDCDMEKGQMRFELNVSLRETTTNNKQPASPAGGQTTKLPDYKVEVKNINSFRFLERALDYEIKRQSNLLKKGKVPIQETRGFDEAGGITVSQRWKEEAQDYRYFPEPDLPPMRWTKKEIEKLKKQLPELPDEKISRFVSQFNILKSQAKILTSTQEKAEYFEEAVKIGKKHDVSAKELAKVIINKRVDVEKLLPAELIQVLVKKKVRPKISDKKLNQAIKQVLRKNKKAVEDYKKGKSTAVEFLVGQVMAETKGGVDPNQTRKLLLEKLG